MQELIQVFACRFINNQSAFYKQWANHSSYGYTACYQAPTIEIIESHLAGNITIAVPAFGENNNGRWICFDSDKENDNLDKLEAFLRQHDWHALREGKRPGRDGHLWILFDSPIPGKCLFDLANAMIKLAGLSGAGLESFPKQLAATKLASGVRLPLGVHRKPGADNCRGLFDIPEKDIESQLIWLKMQPLNDTNTAIELSKIHAPVILPPIRHYGNNVPNGKLISFDHAIQQTNAKRGAGDWWRGHCPTANHANGDQHASLNIRDDNGIAIFNCFAGCTAKEIAACLRNASHLLAV